MQTKPVTVYFDGQCPLCSREIAHHRELTKCSEVSYVDIAAIDFNAASHGVDSRRVQEVLHVKVGDEMRTGIDAVIAMWDAVPAYRWLARLTRLPGVYSVARLGYWGFARFRPYLQRRQRRSCDSGTCR
jgi:ubiquinone biosynthesis monooxygenase Coq7